MALWQLVLALDCAWVADTIDYGFSFATNRPLQNLYDIPVSQWAHWHVLNGRIVVHSIVQLFAGFLGQVPFAIINSLVWVLLIYALCRLCGIRMNNPKGVLTASLLAMIAFDVVVDPPLQINYVWSGLFNLWFLYVWFYKAAGRRGVLPVIFSSLLALVTGACHEGYSVAIGGALCVMVFIGLLRGEKYSIALWLMLGFYLLGSMFMVFAPGNFVRLGVERPGLVASGINLLFSLRVFWVFVVLVIWKGIRHKGFWSSFLKKNSFWCMAVLISLMFNMMIGVGADRQLIPVEMFSIIMILEILSGHSFSRGWTLVFILGVVCISALNFATSRQSSVAFDNVRKSMGTPPGNDTVYYTASWLPNLACGARTFVYYGDDYVMYSIRRVQLDRDETPLIVYPEGFDSVLRLPVRNRVWEFAPRRFMVMQDKAHPATFISRQDIGIGGTTLMSRESEVGFPSDTCCHHRGLPYRIQYLNTGALPIFSHSEVIITE